MDAAPVSDAAIAPAVESATTEVEVRLPEALLVLFPSAPRRLVLAAATVRDLIAALDRRWPGMSDRLTDSRPAIRKHINVFVDGERASLDTRLDAATKVTILLAISGG